MQKYRAQSYPLEYAYDPGLNKRARLDPDQQYPALAHFQGTWGRKDKARGQSTHNQSQRTIIDRAALYTPNQARNADQEGLIRAKIKQVMALCQDDNQELNSNFREIYSAEQEVLNHLLTTESNKNTRKKNSVAYTELLETDENRATTFGPIRNHSNGQSQVKEPKGDKYKQSAIDDLKTERNNEEVGSDPDFGTRSIREKLQGTAILSDDAIEMIEALEKKAVEEIQMLRNDKIYLLKRLNKEIKGHNNEKQARIYLQAEVKRLRAILAHLGYEEQHHTQRPERQHQKPEQHHQRPEQQYQRPEQQYQRPEQQYQRPERHHQRPEQHHQRPERHHQRPEQHHQRPEQHHQRPQRKFNSPAEPPSIKRMNDPRPKKRNYPQLVNHQIRNQENLTNNYPYHQQIAPNEGYSMQAQVEAFEEEQHQLPQQLSRTGSSKQNLRQELNFLKTKLKGYEQEIAGLKNLSRSGDHQVEQLFRQGETIKAKGVKLLQNSGMKSRNKLSEFGVEPDVLNEISHYKTRIATMQRENQHLQQRSSGYGSPVNYRTYDARSKYDSSICRPVITDQKSHKAGIGIDRMSEFESVLGDIRKAAQY